MEPPESNQEFHLRFNAHHRMEGQYVHLPCPFCAARDFLVYDVRLSRQALSEVTTCSECGRASKMIFDGINGSTTVELVQTGGPEQPYWFKPRARMI